MGGPDCLCSDETMREDFHGALGTSAPVIQWEKKGFHEKIQLGSVTVTHRLFKNILGNYHPLIKATVLLGVIKDTEQ